jgi:hypothetical protein
MKRGRGPNYASRAYAPYALAIGQAALAFNHFHDVLGVAFFGINQSPVSGLSQCIAIWQAAQLDRPKRQLFRAALLHLEPISEKRRPLLRSEFEWLLNQADELEDVRNNAVHAPLMQYERELEWPDDTSRIPGTVYPNIHLQNPRAKRLAKKDLLSEYRWCRDVAQVLALYSYDLVRAYAHKEIVWPNRPRLPTRKMRSGRRDQRRQSAAKRRSPRPRSSRG